jgi:hypothetical protein
MNIGDAAKKAKDALGTEQGEQRSDDALDKAGQFADDKTGGKHDAQIDKGRQFADEHIGNEQSGDTGR